MLATMMKDSCTPAPVSTLKAIPPMTVPSHTATPDLRAYGRRQVRPISGAEKAPGEEWPRRMCDAEKVVCLLVTTASDDRENQDADYVDSDRWQDLHDPHITLRPWLLQPIARSRRRPALS